MRRFARHAASSVLTHPSTLPYFLAMPLRRLRRRLGGTRSTECAARLSSFTSPRRRRNTSSVSSVQSAWPWFRSPVPCSDERRSTASGAKVLLHSRVAGAERRVHVAREVLAKPAVERHAEALLRPVEDLGRQEVARRPPSAPA